GGPDGGTRWFNTIQDVTAQKLAANKLRDSEARFRAMFEQAAVGVVHTSFDGDVILANPNFCEMTGLTHVEAIQLNIRELTHPDDITRSVEGRSRLLSETEKHYQ